jgi:hypothetical protein
MNQKQNKIQIPLVTGAVIVRRNITLGLGHTAEIVISYDGPNEPAPESGAQWPPETDWPAAELTIIIPSNQRLIAFGQAQGTLGQMFLHGLEVCQRTPEWI